MKPKSLGVAKTEIEPKQKRHDQKPTAKNSSFQIPKKTAALRVRGLPATSGGLSVYHGLSTSIRKIAPVAVVLSSLKSSAMASAFLALGFLRRTLVGHRRDQGGPTKWVKDEWSSMECHRNSTLQLGWTPINVGTGLICPSKETAATGPSASESQHRIISP